jgi:leader peptidase (prepilin peptidase)/N-methyltransferase
MPLQFEPILWIFFICVLVGYFVNYVSDVLPYTRKFSTPLCVHCQSTFSWKSYLLFLRCENCKKKRSIRTWLVYGIIFAGLIFIWFFPNSLGENTSTVELSRICDFTLKGFAFIYFVLLAVIDLEHKAVLFPVVIFGVLFGAAFGLIYHGWMSTLLGLAVGFGILLLLYYLGKLFVKLLNRKRSEVIDEEALGFGDVNLSGVLGLMLGYPGIFAGLFLGIIIGGVGSLIYLIIGRLRGKYQVFTPLPYAPFLIIGAAYFLFIL